MTFFKAMTVPSKNQPDITEVEGFYVEGISVFTYAIVSKDTGVMYEIDVDTIRESTPVEDVHGDTVYEGDHISFGEDTYKVVSYCDFIAWRGIQSSLRPSLICETDDGNHEQLVKKSSGDDWMKLNSIDANPIVILGRDFEDNKK